MIIRNLKPNTEKAVWLSRAAMQQNAGWVKSDDAKSLRSDIYDILMLELFYNRLDLPESASKKARDSFATKAENNAKNLVIPAFEKLQSELNSPSGPLAELYLPFADSKCAATIGGKAMHVVFAESQHFWDAYLTSSISHTPGFACNVVLTAAEATFFKSQAHFMDFLATQATYPITTNENMLVKLAQPDSEHWNGCICEKRTQHADEIVAEKFQFFKDFMKKINGENSFDKRHEIREAFEFTYLGLFDAPSMQKVFGELLNGYDKLRKDVRSAKEFKEEFYKFWPIYDQLSIFNMIKRRYFFENTRLLRSTNLPGVVESVGSILSSVQRHIFEKPEALGGKTERIDAFSDKVFGILLSVLPKEEPAQDKSE